MAWNAPSTWLASANLSFYNSQIRDNFLALGDVWTTYTPVLSSTGTAPTVSAAEGSYIATGKRIEFDFSVTINSPGTGLYTVTLPPFAALRGSWAGFVIGEGMFRDASPVTPLARTLVLSSATLCSLVDAAGVTVGATAPVTAAAGDRIYGHGCYQAA